MPTEMRFCGLTVPDAVTEETSVACVTGAVMKLSLARECAKQPRRAERGEQQRGRSPEPARDLPEVALDATRGRGGAGIVMVDMTLFSDSRGT